MTQITTLLFGSIGTLVETSELQRQSFNAAFARAGLDWNWDVDTYKSLLAQSGGRQRIADYASTKSVNVDADALHTHKTEIFDKLIVENGLHLRAGVRDVINQAKADGMTLGFVTSTSRANVDAIFDALGDAVSDEDFAFIGDASMVEKSKPAPDIYALALETLNVDKSNCVAIEDTAISMSAAIAAGITCIGFPGEYADLDAFSEGARIVTGALSYADITATP